MKEEELGMQARLFKGKDLVCAYLRPFVLSLFGVIDNNLVLLRVQESVVC